MTAASAVDRGDRVCCSACGRQVQHLDQWRCPWSSCRAWLRDPDEHQEKIR